MSDGKKDDALNRFKDVTGADDERAQFYMESSNWDLDVSIESSENTFVANLVRRPSVSTFFSERPHELPRRQRARIEE